VLCDFYFKFYAWFEIFVQIRRLAFISMKEVGELIFVSLSFCRCFLSVIHELFILDFFRVVWIDWFELKR